MIDTAKLAAEKNGCLHTHLAETEDENAFCEEMFDAGRQITLNRLAG